MVGILQLAPVVRVVAGAEPERVVVEADTAIGVVLVEGADTVGLAETDFGVEVVFAVARVVRVAVETEAVVGAEAAIGVVLVDRVVKSVAAVEEEGLHTKKWRLSLSCESAVCWAGLETADAPHFDVAVLVLLG